MVAHSPASHLSDRKRILDAQLRESFGRVVYSHKSHEKEADILQARSARTKLGQIVLAAISTGGFLAMLVGTAWWGSLVGSACSAMLLALNLYMRNHDLGKQMQQHSDAAVEIWSIRERYFSLITDLAMENESLSAIQQERDTLVDELHAVYARCPRTSSKAYSAAQEALNMRDEMTFRLLRWMPSCHRS